LAEQHWMQRIVGQERWGGGLSVNGNFWTDANGFVHISGIKATLETKNYILRVR
jgi:hypothetical protein